jgi:hypothetical protein
MSLIVPQWGWANCTTNISGTPGNTPGTAVTAGGSANTDGSSVSLITALGHDCEFLVIGAYLFASSTANGSALLDILIDPAGGTSWAAAPVINDLIVGYGDAVQQALTNSGAPRWYYFPLWIKSGASIGARVRCATASVAGRVIAIAYGGNSQPSSWWCGQSVTEIGINAASSAGTSHTPGNTGAFSTWTNFGSTTPAPCGAVQFAIGGGTNTAVANGLAYQMEFGVSSTRIGPPLYQIGNTGEAFSQVIAPGPIFCDLASGTQLQVRGTCSTTAIAVDVGAWVVH